MTRLLKKQPLIGRQAEIYDFMVNFKAENGRVPNTREIAEGAGVSTGNISDAKSALAYKGYIRIIGRGKYEIEGDE